ncbi:MAG: hypothetical protein ACR2PZ_05435 [Pseudomonadales bacterium]
MNRCPPAVGASSDRLNRVCDCLPLSRTQIDEHIVTSNPRVGFAELLEQRPHLFAGTPVFLSAADHQAMLAQVTAIEAVTRLPGYHATIQARDASLITAPGKTTAGLLMGYDFHLTEDGPKLIEVNTNAGGAFAVQALLSAVLSQIAPCDVQMIDPPVQVAKRLLDMFTTEWQQAGRYDQPAVLAIVDDDPAGQYLYPDMLLAQTLLQNAGIDAPIVASHELHIDGGRLRWGDRAIDMVYNRLTDFQLAEPASAALKEALEQDLTVISPNPTHHALLADKRNLSLLCDPEQLKHWGVSAAHQRVLRALPATVPVSSGSAESLWSQRKALFFKPNGGFGSKATYRGSKVTHRVWNQIASGGYVAQSYVPPGVRSVDAEGSAALMKYDVRLYTYAGAPLLSAARVYQGQTTNFRSPGGGFAPVIYLRSTGA